MKSLGFSGRLPEKHSPGKGGFQTARCHYLWKKQFRHFLQNKIIFSRLQGDTKEFSYASFVRSKKNLYDELFPEIAESYDSFQIEASYGTKQMDTSLVTDATVTSLSDLKKRAFYVKVPVPAGKILYVQDTVSTNATLDKYLSGYEVTGICVSNFDRAVNGRIREGDVIDIYAVDKTTDALTLYAQDVYVAAAYDSSGNELATDEGVAVAFTIWVKEAEVEKVNQAINFGEIQIYRK